VEVVAEVMQAMAGGPCRCDEDGQEVCPEHRLFALYRFVDWADETYDVMIEDIDCWAGSYVGQLADGESLEFWEWVDLATSPEYLLLSDYVACAVGEAIYEEYALPPLRNTLGKLVNGKLSEAICEAAFPFLKDGVEKERCQLAVYALFCDPRAPTCDPREMMQNLRELLVVLDDVDHPDRQDVIDGLILRYSDMAGAGLEQSHLDLAREVGALPEDYHDPACDGPAELTLEPADKANDMLYGAFPVGDAQTEGKAEGVQRELAPVPPDPPGGEGEGEGEGEPNQTPPLDLTHFYPLYNTIQLSKLVLMGLGDELNCDWILEICIDRPWLVPDMLCSMVEKQCHWDEPLPAPILAETLELGLPTLPGGLRAVVGLGDARDLPDLLTAAAYDTTAIPMDEVPEHLFGPAGSAELARCAEIEHNVLCDALASIDDPDDYCRDLEAWWAASDVQGDAPDPEEVVHCGARLSGIDDRPHAGQDYGPDPRGLFGADPVPAVVTQADDPRQGEEEGVAAKRSLVVDRVVKQYVEETGFPIPEDEPHLPYRLTPLSLASRDALVARVYSAVFAPYYCPKLEGAAGEQPDRDCDTVPDACDICPDTYNPDQYDRDLDGLGDDCPGYDPAYWFDPELGATPPEQMDLRCPPVCGDGLCEEPEIDEECMQDCEAEILERRSCAGRCGDPSPAPSGCYCDAACEHWCDCCDDAFEQCGFRCPVCGDGICDEGELEDACWWDCQPDVLEQQSCAGRCGDPDPTPSGCYCDAACADHCDCCDDALRECGLRCGGSVQSCFGSCGDQAPGGCWCDEACVNAGDCCPDACGLCGECNPLGSGCDAGWVCGGGLGPGQAPAGCWCDAGCMERGDCCPDACGACLVCDPAASCEGCPPEAPLGCSCGPACQELGTCCADKAAWCG